MPLFLPTLMAMVIGAMVLTSCSDTTQVVRPHETTNQLLLHRAQAEMPAGTVPAEELDVVIVDAMTEAGTRQIGVMARLGDSLVTKTSAWIDDNAAAMSEKRSDGYMVFDELPNREAPYRFSIVVGHRTAECLLARAPDMVMNVDTTIDIADIGQLGLVPYTGSGIADSLAVTSTVAVISESNPDQTPATETWTWKQADDGQIRLPADMMRKLSTTSPPFSVSHFVRRGHYYRYVLPNGLRIGRVRTDHSGTRVNVVR